MHVNGELNWVERLTLQDPPKIMSAMDGLPTVPENALLDG